MNTFESIEHHAYLTTDELPFLEPLFAQGVTKLTVDLRGRTTMSKNKSKISELGIKKLSHTYFDVDREDLEINSPEELNKIITAYNKEGITNLYISRLVVTWSNGNMHEWKRVVLHVKDKETNRIVPNGRQNALVIPLGLYSDVDALRTQYGGDLVHPTVCEIVQEEGKQQRICKSA